MRPSKIGLIEAYWNVNVALIANNAIPRQGLIEAYWNVNVTVTDGDRIAQLRFNRSILKCKWVL